MESFRKISKCALKRSYLDSEDGFMNDKIEKLLDKYTSGLDESPEVKLDIKSELRSHFDTKIQELKKSGLSEKESIEEAIKDFGDTIEIADGIADANAGKLSLRPKW